MNDADHCRKKGWTVGTRLIGTEGGALWRTTTTIELTAIGERLILARKVAQVSERWAPSGEWVVEPEPFSSVGDEGSWTLSCRDWKAVSP